MHWIVEYRVGLVWVTMGYWTDAIGACRPMLYYMKGDAIAAIAMYRKQHKGRYRLGRMRDEGVMT